MNSIPLKYVTRIIAGQAPASDQVEPYGEGFPFIQGNAEFGMESPAPRLQCSTTSKRARKGDVLLSVRAPVGALNIADQNIGIGRGICAIRTEGCHPRFLWWWLHAQGERLDSVATGSTYVAVTAQDVGKLPFPGVSFDEQRRIVDFLDVETARIDTLRTYRGNQKGLLSLRRERFIEDVLELDGDHGSPRMIPLKRLVRNVSVGIVITPAVWYVEGDGVPALRGVNVRPGSIGKDDLVRISNEGDIVNKKSRLRAGDLVVVRTGQAGATAVVPPEFDRANCIDLVIIRVGDTLMPPYLEYVLNSDYARRRIDEYSVGSIQAHFNVGAMKEVPIPVIGLEQQASAVNRLDCEIGKIDALLRCLETQDQVLLERRRALITAAVTGQIDVTTARGAGV